MGKTFNNPESAAGFLLDDFLLDNIAARTEGKSGLYTNSHEMFQLANGILAAKMSLVNIRYGLWGGTPGRIGSYLNGFKGIRLAAPIELAGRQWMLRDGQDFRTAVMGVELVVPDKGGETELNMTQAAMFVPGDRQWDWKEELHPRRRNAIETLLGAISETLPDFDYRVDDSFNEQDLRRLPDMELTSGGHWEVGTVPANQVSTLWQPVEDDIVEIVVTPGSIYS